MFDIYSHCSTNTRIEVFSHPETLPTWVNLARQSRETDIEIRLYKVLSESQLSLFVAKLLAGFRHWQLQLSRRSARQTRIRGHYLPIKHHSPVHR
jgi:hypothetical protein